SANGDYHREERKQVPITAGGRVKLEWAPPDVFEAKMAQAQLDALRAILATPELNSIKGVVGDSGSLTRKLVVDGEGAVRPHAEVEIVTIGVERSHEPQVFELADIDVARQQEPVSELLDWVKGTEQLEKKRTLASQATDCSPQIATAGSSVGEVLMATGMSF